MKALKFDLNIPFWCSFSDFTSLNIKLSYPVPPLTTLFGMILNAMGKPAVHSINNKKYKKQFEIDLINSFNDLKFSIILRNSGELIEDFTNIHKGSRNNKSAYEKELKNILNDYEEKFEKNFNLLFKHEFYLYVINGKNDNDNFNKTLRFLEENDFDFILEIINKFWKQKTKGNLGYNLNKYWMNTQINRQKIVNPYFTIYITSDNDSEFSIENIYKVLHNPIRPLYLGESDDVVDIINMDIVEIMESKSSGIVSIIPRIYSNSDLFKLPVNLKYNLDESMDYHLICSLPYGNIEEEIDCFTFNGENFVFL